MSKKLKIIYELDIREEYLPLIPLVAKMNGWKYSGSGFDIETNEHNVLPEALAYTKEYTKDFVKEQMRQLIETALVGYYGVSQAELIEQAMLDYSEGVSINSDWENSEPTE